MIAKLDKQDFFKIKHITDECLNIEVRAVANGNNPGEIYVDHPTETTAVLIWIQGQEGFQIVGDAQSKSFMLGLEEYMTNQIEPELKKLNIKYVELGAEIDSWTETLHLIFKKRNISSDIQHVLKLKDGLKSSDSEENKVAVRRIDRDLLVLRGFENHSFLERKILHFWNSVDAFLQKGFGYIAEYNNSVVSLCFSAFVADQTHAIDIETLDVYRRRNYGTAVARAFVQECIQKGISPYWDCTPRNTGSIRIAKTIGMSHDFDYKIFWYELS